MKVKRGDLVKVTVGKDRGKESKVEKVYLADQKVLLLGINQYKKHQKPKGEGRPGEIVTASRPLPVDNVALVCPKCKQLTRVGYRFLETKKVRVCRKCGGDI